MEKRSEWVDTGGSPENPAFHNTYRFFFQNKFCNIFLPLSRKHSLLPYFIFVSKLSSPCLFAFLDLEELQRQGRVIRTHGGAVSLYKPSAAFSFQDLSVKCIEEKQQIARTAIDLIADGDSIILDGSTTVQELAKLIVGSGKKDLTIITTSINTAVLFKDKEDVSVVLIGGVINFRMNTMEGVIAEKQLRDLCLDKGFVGINGIDREFGFSTSSFNEAEIKKVFMESARETYVLADHTKFDKKYMVKVTGLEDGGRHIITNRKYGYDYSEWEEKIDMIYAE